MEEIEVHVQFRVPLHVYLQFEDDVPSRISLGRQAHSRMCGVGRQ